LTLLLAGTLDGANIEIREKIGVDNMFVFGANADEVCTCWVLFCVSPPYLQTPKLRANLSSQNHDPRYKEVGIRVSSPSEDSLTHSFNLQVLSAIALGAFGTGLFEPLVHSLARGNDYYLLAHVRVSGVGVRSSV
jgi:hypothetical protein